MKRLLIATLAVLTAFSVYFLKGPIVKAEANLPEYLENFKFQGSYGAIYIGVKLDESDNKYRIYNSEDTFNDSIEQMNNFLNYYNEEIDVKIYVKLESEESYASFLLEKKVFYIFDNYDRFRINKYTSDSKNIVFTHTDNQGSGAENTHIYFEIVQENETETDKYTVNYYVDSEIYETQAVDPGSTLTPPVNPAKEDHVFNGWYLDQEFSEKVYTNTKIEQDTNIYAKFTALNESGIPGDVIDEPTNNNTASIVISITILTVLVAVVLYLSKKRY